MVSALGMAKGIFLGYSPNCEVGSQSDERPENMSVCGFVLGFWIRESHASIYWNTYLSNAE